MSQAHQGSPFSAHETHPAWHRLCYGLGLALALSSWTSQEAWAVSVSPTTMTFQAVQGAPNPASQTVNVSKANSREKQWTASSNASWLTLYPGGGMFTSTAQVAVAVNAVGKAPGTYTTKVSIKVINGGKVSVPVTLIVLPASPTSPPPPSPPPTSPPPPSPPPPSPPPTSPPPPSPPPPSPTPTTATLTWSPNTETDLAGYKVYVGTASGIYGAPIDVGKVTSYVVGNLQLGNTYYFTVTAYDGSSNESLHSAEVTKSSY